MISDPDSETSNVTIKTEPVDTETTDSKSSTEVYDKGMHFTF